LGWSLPMLRMVMPPGHENRAGWYLQQLVKISALLQGDDQDVVLIWDADTMPIRPLDFITQDGKLVYYKGSQQVAQPYSLQHIDPYFVTLKKLLGLDKAVDFSFIAQSFPCYVTWAREMIALIEARHGTTWIEAILASTDLTALSGFSEYETLGNFLTVTHKDQMVLSDRSWEHLGSVYIGIDHMTEKRRARFAPVYDFIAFEIWQQNLSFRPQIETFFHHFFAGPSQKSLLILGGDGLIDLPNFIYFMTSQADLVTGRVLTESAEEQAQTQQWVQFIPRLCVEIAAFPGNLNGIMPKDACETGLVVVVSPNRLAELVASLPQPDTIRPESPLPSYILLPYPTSPEIEGLFTAAATGLAGLGYRLVAFDSMVLAIRFIE
ncbi:MAG: DUF6492 family protein, partial [Alphaproteobacteria bacterium]|nr:DUF6492 family protein [Alphaproteobacteria bacterium]